MWEQAATLGRTKGLSRFFLGGGDRKIWMTFQWAWICDDQFKSKEHVSKVSPWKHCEGNKGVLDLSSPSNPHQLYLCLLSLSIMSQGVGYRPEWSIRITWGFVKKWGFPDAILSLLSENDRREVCESMTLQSLEELYSLSWEILDLKLPCWCPHLSPIN